MAENGNNFIFTMLDVEHWRIMREINLRKEFNGRLYSAKVVYYRNFVEWKTKNAGNVLSLTNDSDLALDEYDNFIIDTIKEHYSDAEIRSCLIYTDIIKTRNRQMLANYEKDYLEIRALPQIGLDYLVNNRGLSFTGYRLRLNLYSTSSEMPLYRNEGYERFFKPEEKQQMKQFIEELCNVCMQS